MPENTQILIVESFQTNIEMITHELDKGLTNYNLKIANTKMEFKKMLLGYKPDLILSNNIFTAHDGMSIFMIRKKLAPQTPFIFVSYPAREEQLIEFYKNGLTDFVLKDDLNSLPVIIKQVLQDIEIDKRDEKVNTEDHSPKQDL